MQCSVPTLENAVQAYLYIELEHLIQNVCAFGPFDKTRTFVPFAFLVVFVTEKFGFKPETLMQDVCMDDYDHT